MAPAVEGRSYINGKYVECKSGKTFTLLNPANGDKVGEIQIAGEHEVEMAVDAAEVAQKAWADLSAADRAAKLNKWAALVRDNASKLGELDGVAMGRPVSGNYDSMIAANAIEYNAGLAQNVHGHSSLLSPGHMNFTVKQPFGVTAGITPWNVPIIMVCFKVAPSLAAGNAIIIKSSEKSPLTGTYLTKLATEAGIPDGLFSCLNGLGETGKLISEHMRIRKISFTGSTRTGRHIMAAAAHSNLKAVTLELGGKSPTLIFDDADLDEAVPACTFSIAWNSGQICMANSRLYVHEKIYDEFAKRFTASFSQFKQGDPLDKSTTMGPQADSIQAKAVQGYLDIGKQDGKVLLGGEKSKEGENFFMPTVYSDIPENSRINKEEVFGPVVILHKFSSENDVVAKANDTEYGLYAAVYSQNIDRALRVAKRLEAGTVGVNCTSPSGGQDMVFGGFKTSGVGREGGPNSLNAWLEEKSVIIKVKGF